MTLLDPRTGLGLVQVYTGDGKGKTTAALGLALRAAGHGFRVVVIQFLKGGHDAGEHTFVARFPGFEIVRTATQDLLRADAGTRRREAERTLQVARDAVQGDRYDVVVLDEVLVAAARGVLAEAEVIELVQTRRPGLEVVLTGRYASPAIIALADTVTEMQAVRHHYQAGVPLTAGREY